MKQYKKTAHGTFIDMTTGASFPDDMDNRFREQMQRELDAGEAELLEADPVPTNPRDAVITEMRALEDQQARAVRECLLALAGQGVSLPAEAAARLSSIEEQISALRAQLAGA